MVRISDKEREDTLESISRNIEYWPNLPYFKDEASVEQSLRSRNVDFIADTWYWQGTIKEKWGTVREVKPWHSAKIGFEITARSIRRLIETINFLISKHKDAEFIYFTCNSPEIPFPHHSYVETGERNFYETRYEFSRVEEISEEYYDR